MLIRVKLPTGPLINLWGFCKSIADAVSPRYKSLEGVDCVSGKIYPPDVQTPIFGIAGPYPLDEADQQALSNLLVQLPRLRYLMPEEEIASFMKAYASLADRPTWTPQLLTKETVIVRKLKHDQVVDRHLKAIRQEHISGRLVPVDIDYVPVEAEQLGAHLTRKDAIAYLERHGLMYEDEEIAKGLKQDALKSEAEAQSLSGDEKKAAIVKFHAELKAKGDNSPSKKTAIEFNVVETYVRRVIRETKNAKKKEPSPGNRSVYKNGKEVVPPKRN